MGQGTVLCPSKKVYNKQRNLLLGRKTVPRPMRNVVPEH